MFSVPVIEARCILFLKKIFKKIFDSIFKLSRSFTFFFLGVSDINSKNWADHENKTVKKITVVGGGELGVACTLAISAKVCKHGGYKYIYLIAALLGSLWLVYKK